MRGLATLPALLVPRAPAAAAVLTLVAADGSPWALPEGQPPVRLRRAVARSATVTGLGLGPQPADDPSGVYLAARDQRGAERLMRGQPGMPLGLGPGARARRPAPRRLAYPASTSSSRAPGGSTSTRAPVGAVG